MKHTMLALSNLTPERYSRPKRKRIGRGESSGWGKTSGRGSKGQKARSGGSIRLGFEGGQMPLLRKLPKHGFDNKSFKIVWGIVNLRDLNDFPPGSVVDEEALRERSLIRGRVHGIKVLGDGNIAPAMIFKVDSVSRLARMKIESAGGRIEGCALMC